MTPDGDGVAIAGVRLTSPDRVLFAELGLTKEALARYYDAIAEWILPDLKKRPLSLVRCPQGPGEGCFFQKHIDAAWSSSTSWARPRARSTSPTAWCSISIRIPRCHGAR